MTQQEIQDLVTIIIPSRNIDFLLENTIKEIRSLYKTVKITVILDEINKELDKDIIILKSNSINMSSKRNQGVKEANTKYIAFIDSDAYPKENWLENGITFLENNTNYSVVTGNQFNPQTDNFTQKCLRLVRFSRIFTHSEWCIVIDKNAKEQDCTEFMTSNAMMRKEDYIELEGMNENIYLAEDNEFSLRLIKNGYKIRFIPSVSVYHREATMKPFLRKIYCMSYYYANKALKGKSVKTFEQTVAQFLPLFGVLLFILLYMAMPNPLPLLVLPLLAFLILIIEAIKTTKRLEEHKLKGFCIILFTFCMFCLIWVVGSLLGILNFPTKKIENSYKHY